MAMNIYDSLETAKRYLEYQMNGAPLSKVNSFNHFGRVYPHTNENIKGYLNLFSLTGYQKALSVMSSGDHPFNLIHRGILNIDTFDRNSLTEYYALGLRRALIMKFPYEQYKGAHQLLTSKMISLVEELDIINSSLSFMDERYRIFWKELIDFANNNSEAIEDSSDTIHNTLLSRLFHSYKQNDLSFNGFLDSESEYNVFKERLSQANITFTESDIMELASITPKKFDVILLSNILDWFYSSNGIEWAYGPLTEFKNNMLSILSQDGVCFLNYLFFVPGYLGKGQKVLFNYSMPYTDVFNGENEKIIPFQYVSEHKFEESAVLVLKRGINKGGDINGH